MAGESVSYDGEESLARRFFEKAAVLSVQIARELPRGMAAVRGTWAVRAVSLYMRAGKWGLAEVVAKGFLGDPLRFLDRDSESELVILAVECQRIRKSGTSNSSVVNCANSRLTEPPQTLEGEGSKT